MRLPKSKVAASIRGESVVVLSHLPPISAERSLGYFTIGHRDDVPVGLALSLGSSGISGDKIKLEPRFTI